MSIGNPKYRLFESTGFLYPEPFPAFGDSDDFDALASWAVDHNDWQGKSNAALIVSDEGRFWKVQPNGSISEISSARQQSGGSQVARYAARLAHGPAPGDNRYEPPPRERWQHATIHVAAKTTQPKQLPQKDAVWIFQANPKRYDLLDFLARPSTQPGIVDDWTLRQHAKDVSDGDTVLLWTAGDQAGIYATGTIVGESFMRPRQDWEPEDAPPESRTIHFRLDRILFDHPVLRRDLINHPVLKDLSVIRQAQGTNFAVTEQQWEALRPMIESPSGTQATPLPPAQRFDPSDDLEWLLRETLWSRAEVDDVLDTLRTRRPQIILARSIDGNGFGAVFVDDLFEVALQFGLASVGAAPVIGAKRVGVELGMDVYFGAGITVFPPGAADTVSFLEDGEVAQVRLGELDSRADAGKAPADDCDLRHGSHRRSRRAEAVRE